MRMRRLPYGGETDHVDFYLAEWDTLCVAVKEIFPGYTVSSYDPGVALTLWSEPDKNGKSAALDRVELSIRAITTLNKRFADVMETSKAKTQGGKQ